MTDERPDALIEVPLPPEWSRRAILVRGEPDQAFFTDEELARAHSFTLPKRQAEWKLSRAAAKQFAVRTGFASDPRSCTVSEERRLIVAQVMRPLFVSLSHSAPYAAAAIDGSPIGIDVERLREIRGQAARLFLTLEEEAVMKGCSLPYRLLHFWAAKEAAWKRAGGAIETLKRMALKLEAETENGLRFTEVETTILGDAVVALTRPTS